MASLTGCASSGSKSSGTGSSGTSATYVYAIDNASSDILQYAANSNGSVSPSATIIPPSGFTGNAVATDASGNIYLAGYDSDDNSTVLVYAKGSTGAATPTATLLGGENFVYPQSIVVDASGKIYVLDAGIGDDSDGVSVSVYAAGANGAATPVRTITDTTNDSLFGLDLAVDATGNVFVSANDTDTETGVMAEYASTANGNVTPTRTITNTGFFYGIAVDSSDTVYIADDDNTTGTNGLIVEFGSTATGAATPTTTITGSSTGISFGGGLRLDSDKNIFLINETPGTSSFSVNLLAFAAGSSGNAAPVTVLTSSTLDDPDAIIALY